MACGPRRMAPSPFDKLRTLSLPNGRSRGAESPEPVEGLKVPSLSRGLFSRYNDSANMNALVAEARRMISSLPAVNPTKNLPVVYFLRLRSGIIYVGASTDLKQRLGDHASGQACRTTQIDPPLHFLRVEVFASFTEARTREAQLKRWSRAKKEALVRGDIEALHFLSQSR